MFTTKDGRSVNLPTKNGAGIRAIRSREVVRRHGDHSAAAREIEFVHYSRSKNRKVA